MAAATYSIADHLRRSIEDGREEGSKGDLYRPTCLPKKIAGLTLINGVTGEPLTGMEREDEQPSMIYMSKPTNGDYFIKAISPHDARRRALEGEAGIVTIGFDIILNGADQSIIAEALQDPRFKIRYTPNTRDELRQAMRYYAGEAGFEILAFLGKPTEFRHVYPKDGIFSIEDAANMLGNEAEAVVEYKYANIYKAALRLAGFDVDAMERDGRFEQVERNLDAFLVGPAERRSANMGADVVESAHTIADLSVRECGIIMGEIIIPSETVLAITRDAMSNGLGEPARTYRNIMKDIIPATEEQYPEMFFNPLARARIDTLETARSQRRYPMLHEIELIGEAAEVT